MIERNEGSSPHGEHVDFDPFAGGVIDRVVPMTEAQQEIWTSVQLGDDGNCAFNESIALMLRGELDRQALGSAFNDVVDRHEALRATCSTDGKTLSIARSVTIPMPVIDLTDLEEQAANDRYADILRHEAITPIDIQHGPVLRVSLVRLAADHHQMVMTVHHIVCDGWSLGVILEDLGRLYNSRRSNIASGLGTPDSFGDYALAMAKRRQGGQDAEDSAFWHGVFSVPPEPLDLPGDRKRPSLRSFEAARYDYVLDAALVTSLKDLAGKSGVTFLSVMLSGLSSYLYRISGQEDLVIGVPAAGQFSSGKYSLVGHCVSLMPIRFQVDSTSSVAENMKAQRPLLMDAFEHQNFTYGSLLQKLPLVRDPSRSPLVSVVFNIDTGIDELGFAELETRVTTPARAYENFEIFINATDVDGALEMECTYNTDLFSRGWMQRRMNEFSVLLEGMTLTPEARVSSLPLMPADQIAALRALNNTVRPCLHSRGVAGLFEQQAIQTPAATAVQFESVCLTYTELNVRANRLAHRLAVAGVDSDSLVGIYLPRGLEMLVSILAVMKTGAAYVPLDPDYPGARLAFMVEDADLSLVLTHTGLVDSPLPWDVEQVVVDVDSQLAEQPVSDPVHAIEGEATVYVIYTSGSTGKPKGVQIKQQALANFLTSMAERPGISTDDTLLAVTTISFDIATLELFLPLISGAKLVIASRDTASDGLQLMALLAASGATIMQATPATWHMLLAAGWTGGSGLKVLCGGEALPISLASELLARSREVWNMYGPTETTVWSTCCRLEAGAPEVSIGTPIANTTVHVLDENQRQVPVGVPGELYIGGLGLSKGYLNRPDLTQKKFFLDQPADGDARLLYRTGDLVHIGADQKLYYHNRLDNQVKIRGFRIELGEIETALASHEQIGNNVVVARGGELGDTRLVAYYVGRGTSEIAPAELRSHLRRMLPDYMVPQHFVALDALPLTPAGKVDRRLLPDPGGEVADTAAATFVAPSTEQELAVAEIWARALARDQVGLDDNFFDLGGHSLLATQILAQIKKRLGRALSLREFFEQPTITGLVELLNRDQNTDPVTAITRRADRQSARLSLQQQRLWYIEELEPDSTVYNLPAAFRIFGTLDLPLFRQSLDAVFARHEAMRTRIVKEDGAPRQEISAGCAYELPLVDLSDFGPEQREDRLHDLILKETKKAYKLSSPTLFRATMFVLEPEQHVFFFMPHHAIWDGWSFDIFLSDLKELYESAEAGRAPDLGELPVQYADYAEWQRDWADSGALDGQLKYWENQLGGVLPVLDLPTDKPRPPVLTYDNGASEPLTLSREMTDQLTALAREQDATLFMILLAAFNVLLHRYAADQTDILVGVPISGRNHEETANVIGFFVNTIVIRTAINPDQPFAELLRQVRETCLEAYNHQDTPFERLIELLKPARDRSRSPIFQVMFAYQDVRNRQSGLGDLRLEQINISRSGVQTDIDFWVRLSDSGIAGGFEYNGDLFEPETIRQMLRHYKHVLGVILKSFQDPIRSISVQNDDDRQQLVAQHSRSAVAVGEVGMIHEMFQSQVEASPDAIAIINGFDQITYGGLEQRANRLANQFRMHGTRAGSLVGVHLERSIDMLASVMAILKLGAAYVPMDPDYPQERLAMMVEDAAPSLIVTERVLKEKLPTGGPRLLCLEDLDRDGGDDSRPVVSASPESLAYVIFTSGSTGRPKGVKVPHRAVSNFLQSMQQEPGIRAEDVLLAVTPLSFDISVLELFLPLTVGAKVVYADKKTIGDASRLSRLMSECNVTVMQATPITWRMLLASGWKGLPNLKILCGGEPFPRDLAEQLLGMCGSLWNMYGPTETTVWSTCARISDVTQPPLIGRPIANTRVYVVDKDLEPVPEGVAGELMISGAGVSQGYLGLPAVTKDRFIPDPFWPTDDGGAARLMYRTGDLVRYQRDGSLEFLSRLDDQVKVRGFRIELGEIETTLAKHPGVSRAVVTCREERPGDKRLVAHVMPAEAGTIVATELRDHLRVTLPEYMLPQHFVEIAEIPITPAGKIDRRAIPLLDLANLGQEESVSIPESETEEKLHAIWCNILQVEAVDTQADFFDVGGHSLLAVELFSAIKGVFGTELPLADLFDAPTIHLLARRIDAAAYVAGTNGASGTDTDEDREDFVF